MAAWNTNDLVEDNIIQASTAVTSLSCRSLWRILVCIQDCNLCHKAICGEVVYSWSWSRICIWDWV